MGKKKFELKVSLEDCVHQAFQGLAELVFEDYGIRVEAVYLNWSENGDDGEETQPFVKSTFCETTAESRKTATPDAARAANSV